MLNSCQRKETQFAVGQWFQCGADGWILPLMTQCCYSIHSPWSPGWMSFHLKFQVYSVVWGICYLNDFNTCSPAWSPNGAKCKSWEFRIPSLCKGHQRAPAWPISEHRLDSLVKCSNCICFNAKMTHQHCYSVSQTLHVEVEFSDNILRYMWGHWKMIRPWK